MTESGLGIRYENTLKKTEWTFKFTILFTVPKVKERKAQKKVLRMIERNIKKIIINFTNKYLRKKSILNEPEWIKDKILTNKQTNKKWNIYL